MFGLLRSAVKDGFVLLEESLRCRKVESLIGGQKYAASMPRSAAPQQRAHLSDDETVAKMGHPDFRCGPPAPPPAKVCKVFQRWRIGLDFKGLVA